MSIWANNGNGKKCLAGMGMEIGLKWEWEGIGKLKAIPAHPLTRVTIVFPESWMFGGDFQFA